MRLLITRPAEQADKTIEGLENRGHTCILEPMLHVVHTHAPLPPDSGAKINGWDGILVTSLNAIPALLSPFIANGRTDIPVLSTGEATKLALEEIGFTNVTHANGSALDVAAHVPEWLGKNQLDSSAKILYPSAQKTAHDLSALLKAMNVSCHTWIVYQTQEATKFSATTEQALGSGAIDGVLLYSPRSARCFGQLVQQTKTSGNDLVYFVLSDNIAGALPNVPKTSIFIASEPNEEAMLSLIDDYTL